jgi:hypothetical protein
MRHVIIKINFHDYQPFNGLTYNHSLASDPQESFNLIRFVKTHYKYNVYHTETYQSMINTAIKSNNLVGLEILWMGMYCHDKSDPNYEHDVYTATEFGHLKTVQHVLYAYMNYYTSCKIKNLNYDRLQILAFRNKDYNVSRFIKILYPCTVNNKLKSIEENYDLGDDKLYNLSKKFYRCVEQFV